MEINGNTESINKNGKNSATQRYSRDEAADYCGVSVVTIDRALAGEKLGCYRIGRRIVFSKQHLDEFLSRNECKARVYGKNKKKPEWFLDGKNKKKPEWFLDEQELALDK
ncbi:MAG: helix-turn-helix domain-containing protein [Acidobacteria bacterium]|nr:helix-turn-helix domain-containing protein [Acidobacteriota bacterium]